MARAGLTRDRVVGEAAALADEVGLQRLTIAAVAKRFGVAQPSLYKHIDSLDGLLRDLAVLGVRELTKNVSRAAAGKARGEALAAIATAYRDYATTRPGPYEASLRAPAPTDAEHIAAAAELLGLAAAVLSGYGIEGDDLTDAIRVLRAALHGYVSLEAAGGLKMARSNELTYHRMVAALDLAYSTWATTAPEAGAGSAPLHTEGKAR